MQADFYFDIKMAVSPAAALDKTARFERGGDEPMITAPPAHILWAGKVFKELHLTGVDVKQSFAIDLPGWRSGDFKKVGEIIRVFTQTREIADGIADRLEQRAGLGSETVVGRTQKVPELFEGPYVVLKRVRQPLRSKMQPETYRERMNQLRQLPSIRMVSNSREQAFFLAFLRERKAVLAEGNAMPDSYGLSLPTKMVLLPDLSGKRREKP